MLNRHDTGLVVIDIQGKLARIVHESERFLRNTQTLVHGCRILELPIVWLEQNPQGLGPTVPELEEPLEGCRPLEKHTFDACASEGFMQAVAATGVRQWLVCGIEAHICVYQTAIGLLSRGYGVEVVADCVSSRSASNKQLALNKLERMGAGTTSVEMCLYELVKDSRSPAFKRILALAKS